MHCAVTPVSISMSDARFFLDINFGINMIEVKIQYSAYFLNCADFKFIG